MFLFQGPPGSEMQGRLASLQTGNGPWGWESGFLLQVAFALPNMMIELVSQIFVGKKQVFIAELIWQAPPPLGKSPLSFPGCQVKSSGVILGHF